MSLPSLDEIAEKHRLSYHFGLLDSVGSRLGFEGKRVLEIGGALPSELVLGHLGASQWIAVDHFGNYSVAEHRGHAFYRDDRLADRAPRSGQTIQAAADAVIPSDAWARIDGDAADLGGAFDGSIDLIVSIAAFEHILDLPATLRMIRRVLRPGGIAALSVGPIWSGSRGHHVYESYFPDFADKTKAFVSQLQPWEHLLRNRAGMYQVCRARFGATFAELVCYCIYESPHLNRLFAEEYMQLFEVCGFGVEHIAPWPAKDRSLLKQVMQRHPGHRYFEIDGFDIFLKVVEEPQGQGPTPA